MGFGYIPKNRPDKSRLWNITYRLIHLLFGFPSYLRRLQAPVQLSFLGVRKSDTIVDLACGKGHLAYEIAKKGSVTMALDIDLSAKEVIPDKLPNLSFLQCDAKSLPLHSESVDKIIMSSFLQMIEEDKVVLGECHRVLKENGILVLSVPGNHLYLPKLYYPCWFCRKLRSLLNLTDDYTAFLSDLNNLFGVKGKGYYSLSELKDLITKQGFVVERYEYCPRAVGSFIHEFLLSIYYASGGKRLLSVCMFLFYPLGLIDYLLPRNNKGCGITLKARKA